jgi:hypothetical protein
MGVDVVYISIHFVKGNFFFFTEIYNLTMYTVLYIEIKFT